MSDEQRKRFDHLQFLIFLLTLCAEQHRTLDDFLEKPCLRSSMDEYRFYETQ